MQLAVSMMIIIKYHQINNIEGWVIQMTKGLELPFNLNIKGDFFHLEPEDNYVSIFVWLHYDGRRL